jgi:polyribonucleotide nucleotidyltransferase
MIDKLSVEKIVQDFNWNDKKVSFQTGFLAPQADGSVLIKFEWIEFLSTAVLNKNPDPNKDFLPLLVDFREMFYSAGKIWWAPYKRKEWKPSDDAVLVSRIIDRSLRPMFEDGMINDVVITVNTLQIDRENLFAVPAIISASLSVMLSGISFPAVGAVRIWYKDWKFIVNPTKDETWIMNLVVAWTKDTVTMIEAWGEDIPTDILLQAIDLAQKELKVICEKMEEYVKKVEKLKSKKVEKFMGEIRWRIQMKVDEGEESWLLRNQKYVVKNVLPEDLFNEVYKISLDYKDKFFPSDKKHFQEIYEELTDAVNNWFDSLAEGEQLNLLNIESPDDLSSKKKIFLNIAVFKAVKKLMRTYLLSTGNRLDGRNPYQVRPLYTEVWLLERVHGSWLFQRWETQVLSLTTLWAPGKVLLQDTLEKDDEEERFLHHYYMLPFSTNEARWYRWQGRREIGHGYLAEKTLRPIIPDEKDFPYTIRVVSEVLSSNGSTSMASVCAGCLSLMDAWVPIKKPVSGIAMWLVIEELSKEEIENYSKNNKYLKIVEIDWKNFGYIILTDLQWQEDFTWDMDFKVAWSADGINALQMDMKVKWLPTKVLQEAIQQANEARAEILNFMLQTISKPREEISPYAPKLTTLHLTPDNVRTIIGKWWETIKSIIEKTGVAIDFEEDGTTIITAENPEKAQQAVDIIMDLIWEPKIWERIKWKIIRVESYGVFVDLGKWKVWLAHIRSFKEYIEDLTKKFNIWDELEVEITAIWEDGKIQVKPIE